MTLVQQQFIWVHYIVECVWINIASLSTHKAEEMHFRPDDSPLFFTPPREFCCGIPVEEQKHSTYSNYLSGKGLQVVFICIIHINQRNRRQKKWHYHGMSGEKGQSPSHRDPPCVARRITFSSHSPVSVYVCPLGGDLIQWYPSLVYPLIISDSSCHKYLLAIAK